MSERLLYLSTRKRQYSGDICAIHGPRQDQGAVDMSTKPSKQPRPQVANKGWGELFKDRKTFVEMHIC